MALPSVLKHLKLDIGSGDPSTNEKQADGYLKQDIEAYPGIDLMCDIRDIPKYLPPESCLEIRASHVLEHFGTKEVDKVLSMLYSLLEPGGKLIIYVPNFRWHAQLVLNGHDEKAVYYAFGGQLDEWDYHKTAFTPATLHNKLVKAGFTCFVEEETSLYAEATKN